MLMLSMNLRIHYPVLERLSSKRQVKVHMWLSWYHEDCIADNEKRKCRKVMESNGLKYFAKRVVSFSKTKTSKDNGERI